MPLTEFPLKSGIAGAAGEETEAEPLASRRLSAWLRDVREEGRLHRGGGEGGAQEEMMGTEPVSPALAGRFFTTEPPGRLRWLLSVLSMAHRADVSHGGALS